MEFSLPKAVLFIIETLNAAGYEAYAVGGCVRDMLRGTTPQDWDITTSARPEQTKACFADLRVIETGMQHGTVALLIGDAIYEVTTYRIDGDYTDSRHPQNVEFVSNVRLDLARRDFTVNAMGYHPTFGLCDPFSGQADLKDNILRCVGAPSERLEEDALRIMRALRFASVLSFSIHPDTAVSIHALKENLNRIAKERIRVELCKLLAGDKAGEVLREYADVICTVIPELSAYQAAWGDTVDAIMASDAEEIIRLTLLLCAVEQQAKTVLTRLRFDKKTVDTVCKLVQLMALELPETEVAIKKMVSKYGMEDLTAWLGCKKAVAFAKKEMDCIHRIDEILAYAQTLYDEQACLSIAQLSVTGADLKEIGIPQGKQIGETLNRLLDAVLEQKVENQKQALLWYAQHAL